MSLIETKEKDQGIGSIKMNIDTCFNPWLTKHGFGNIESFDAFSRCRTQGDIRLILVPYKISIKSLQSLLFLQA
jgi:hypothetical protein